jgi:enamine deaminase RidA (YjgF/YER057c/UK114 family)
MTSLISQRLAEHGIVLPEPAAPVAAYVPTVLDGVLMTGRLGEDRDVDFGRRAARACAIMLLAQASKALGGLDHVRRIVKLGVFINSAADFTEQPKVANGASELMEQIFGEAGKHARSAVGVPVLPLGAVVEVDAIVAVQEG